MAKSSPKPSHGRRRDERRRWRRSCRAGARRRAQPARVSRSTGTAISSGRSRAAASKARFSPAPRRCWRPASRLCWSSASATKGPGRSGWLAAAPSGFLSNKSPISRFSTASPRGWRRARRVFRWSTSPAAPGRGQMLGAFDAQATQAIRTAQAGGRDALVETAQGQFFLEFWRPPLRLFIVGAVHIAQALAPIAAAAGYDIVIIDPRDAFATPERFAGFSLRAEWPDEVFSTLRIDERCALVALSHEPRIDDSGLIAALRGRGLLYRRARVAHDGGKATRPAARRRIFRSRSGAHPWPHRPADRSGQSGGNRHRHRRRNDRRLAQGPRSRRRSRALSRWGAPPNEIHHRRDRRRGRRDPRPCAPAARPRPRQGQAARFRSPRAIAPRRGRTGHGRAARTGRRAGGSRRRARLARSRRTRAWSPARRIRDASISARPRGDCCCSTPPGSMRSTASTRRSPSRHCPCARWSSPDRPWRRSRSIPMPSAKPSSPRGRRRQALFASRHSSRFAPR